MSREATFDVLVIGSGAAGLARGRLGRASRCPRGRSRRRRSLQACNSSKAQGGIQAAFGGRRLARPARGGRAAARRTAPRTPALVEVLTSEAPARDRVARGARRARSRARTAATGSPAAAVPRASDCSRSAIAPGHAITKALREALEAAEGGDARATHAPGTRAELARAGVPRSTRPSGPATSPPAAVVLAAGGAASRRPGRAASSRRTIPNATGEVTRARARRSEPRRATSTRSSTTRTAAPGPRRCRATRSPRRPARTAPCS